jgi:hypothetical protein
MMTADWMTLVLGLGLALAVAALAWIGLRGGGLRVEQGCSFVCPRYGSAVECRIVQDVRTGQWKGVTACSAFPLGQVLCEEDCARLMNLGARLPQARPS